MEKTIQYTLFDYFFDEDEFTLNEANQVVNESANLNVHNSSIRARIYEGINEGIFTRISRGVYKVTSQRKNGETNTCLMINGNGNGRDLSMIDDNSIDAIVTDHPYDLKKSLDGGNRKLAKYKRFKYTKKDFEEKIRVLKNGAFLVELLPEENDNNFEYLYEIKKIAKEVGFHYYSKVAWKKGNFVGNTGRKSKNFEDVLFFSKGKARCMRLDTKKNKKILTENGISFIGKNSYEIRDLLIEKNIEYYYMSGTSGMLPTNFDIQPTEKKKEIMDAEKPVNLYKQIISFISTPQELLLDQFGGSGNFAKACLETNRNCIIIEEDDNIFNKMKKNICNIQNSNITLATIN